VTTPTNKHTDSSSVAKSSSIFAHDYPVPVAVTLIAITYLVTIALPFRFAWTINNLVPLVLAHKNYADSQIQAMPTALIVITLLIPTIFFFTLEFTIMRSYPSVSRTIKILFITSIIISSTLIGFISPPLSL
jgi:hypothetical protein